MLSVIRDQKFYSSAHN